MGRLPAARLEKVLATRSALERNTYDDPQILDTTVCRVCEELAMMRSENLAV